MPLIQMALRPIPEGMLEARVADFWIEERGGIGKL